MNHLPLLNNLSVVASDYVLSPSLMILGWGVVAIPDEMVAFHPEDITLYLEALMQTREFAGQNHAVLDALLFERPAGGWEIHWDWLADPVLEMDLARSYEVLASDVADTLVAIEMAA